MRQGINKVKNIFEFLIQKNQCLGSLPPEIGQALLLHRVDASSNGFCGELLDEIRKHDLVEQLFFVA
jgi:hypothetical protein